MQKSNGFRCFGFLIGQRQADLDAKSVGFVVFQRDCAVAAANDASINGQTQACTCNATAGAVATFERAHQTIGLTHVKAGAFVAHRQDGSCLFTVDLHRKMQKIVFTLAVAKGVGEEVLYDTREFDRVGVNKYVVFNVCFELTAGSIPDEPLKWRV